MRCAVLLAVSGLVASSTASVYGTSSPNTTCNFFKQYYPNMTILPSDSEYITENEVSWNAGNWLGPACVLVPANAEQMSCAVQNLVKFNTKFAMRGGGHMPIPDAANINSSGILISSTNLKALQLSDDLGTLAIGPGKRWGDAYIYLNSTGTGKMVVGGRYGPVGVPGYLLGGGMSFYSYEYGFSSTAGNVRAFECVLADGRIAMVTETNEYADLFWALQGGGNSFCLLTTVYLRTIDSPVIGLAMAEYGQGEVIKEDWLDSILNYVTNGSSDPKAAIIPVANYGSGLTTPSYGSTLFYNGNATAPEVLSDFQGGRLPAGDTTALAPVTMALFAELVTPAFEPGGESWGLQQRFHVMSTQATKEAMEIVHNTYFDAAPELYNLTSFYTGLAFNSITTKFIEVSNSGIGCPQGVEEKPLFWVEESFSWGDPADDPIIEEWITKVNANITSQLEAINATAKYLYLNDADPDQPVFEGYPKENVLRLQAIRDKYDPKMIFTNLMPGGFKVAHTVV